LHDDDAGIREEAVEALGDIGGEAATRYLEQALTDYHRPVREAAAENLAKLRNRER
jgi:HEAT repeat protein